MPTTKNALLRYKYLDDLLSDRHHYYTTRELWEKCNEKLGEDGAVTLRCIQDDIKDLEYEPFYAELERFRKDGRACVRYANPSFSIFKKDMSNEERALLREVLSTLGQFEGLDNFEWLDRFKADLDVEERRQIISFSNNPYLQNKNLLGTLFDDISNEVVIKLTYHAFKDKDARTTVIHPYLLKQYNDRWFLFGADDSDKKILNFALDRIEDIEPMPEKKYVKCPDDFNERFEDIVGVTLYENRPVEHILFWVSDESKAYVMTKPIHASQTQYKGEREQRLRDSYPTLSGGSFFSADCIRNYELIRMLCSFGKELIVLQSDSNIEDEIYKHVSEMKEKYDEMRR